MRRARFAPWSGSPGVVASVDPNAPRSGVLTAAAQPASLDDQGAVSITGSLTAAAQSASFAGTANSVGGVLTAAAQAAVFAGTGSLTSTGALIAAAQAAGVVASGTVSSGLTPATFDFDPKYNITLGSSLRLTGSGQSIGLSVTPASGGSLTYATNCPGLMLEITGTGALGAGVFRVSYNSGTSWAYSGVTIPAGGTYDLDGAALGLRLTFSAGTYTSGASYLGRCTQWQSREGYTVTQATLLNMPTYHNLGDGAPYLQSYIANSTIMIGTDAAVLAVLTNNPAFTLMQKIAVDVPDAISFQFSVADGAAASNSNRRFGTDTGGNGRWAHQATNDAAATFPAISGTDINNSTHLLEWYSPGTTLTLYQDGTVTSINGTACNPGTLTPTRYAFFGRANSTPASFFGGRTYRTVGFNSQLNPATTGADWRTAIG